jgi:hypothetical protein
MANLPQVIVTLAPNGCLIAELPGPNGARRKVDLAGDCEATLTRILQNQLRNRVEIGLDGAPTNAQVKHWERHGIWADPTCAFCIAEQRTRGGKKPRTDASPRGDGSVQVRRIGRKDTTKLKAKHKREQKALIKRADKAKQDKELEPFFRSIGL